MRSKSNTCRRKSKSINKRHHYDASILSNNSVKTLLAYLFGKLLEAIVSIYIDSITGFSVKHMTHITIYEFMCFVYRMFFIVIYLMYKLQELISMVNAFM
jgi:hypothetical protein